MRNQLHEKQNIELAHGLRGKRVMVSGATGLIGSRVVFRLLELNEKESAGVLIIALYRDKGKKDRIFCNLSKREDIAFIQCDLEKNNLDLPQADYIIHCAGVSGGSKLRMTDPLKVFHAGIGGTAFMLDFAVKHDCKGFLFASSYEIYGESSSNTLISENHSSTLDLFVLRNCYAEVKRCCESLLCAYHATYNLPVFAARLTSTFGAGVAYDDPRFFAEFARCILEEKNIVLKSTGSTIRSYLDADDAATAFLYILLRGESNNAYNLTNMENAISIRGIAKKMIEISGKSIQIEFSIAADAHKLGMRKESTTLLDATKLQALGWKPVHTLEETISALLASIRETRSLKGDNDK